MILTFNGTDHGKREELQRKTTGQPRVPARTEPAMDVLEDNDSVIIKLNVPGARPEHVEVSLEKNVLTVQVQPVEASQQGRYLLRERSDSVLSRTLTLPYDVESSLASATCKDGVLTLVLPRTKRSRNIRINIQ